MRRSVVSERFLTPERFLIGALLIVSARTECQLLGVDDAINAGAEGCRSVVLVECDQAQQQQAAPTGAPASSLQATRQSLDAHRLQQQKRAKAADPNTIQITAERPTTIESDPWDDFRETVGSSAVPGCLGSTPPPQSPPFEARGLLTVPYAAATGKCR